MLDFIKGLNILKCLFYNANAYCIPFINVFYSAFQTDTIVKSNILTVTHLTLHKSLV